MLLDLVSRALARARTRLPAVRCSSTIRGDQEHLHSILEESDISSLPRDNGPEWIEQGIQRKFRPGLFIRPHYFTYKHRFMQKVSRTAPPIVAPSRKKALQHDVLREFGIDPIWETGNPTLLAHFLTDMSKIRPRTLTGVTTKTQRRVAKAIRRAKMMGVLPLFYNPRLIPNKKGQY